MRIALTCNGPGEFAGWVRPLARAFEALAPEVELHCFFVPDDYATGREAELARVSLPGLRVHPPQQYKKFALGARTELHHFDGVFYLGGDVLHAVRIHSRLGGAFFAYRYAPKHVAKLVRRAFALDEKNAARLRETLPAGRIEITGNLAVDGAFAEAGGVFGKAGFVVEDGIIFMPGSRRHEIANMVPFFATAAMHARRILPAMPISFGISPFTEISEIEAALARPAQARMYARPARVVMREGRPHILVDGAADPFPIVRDALQSAVGSRLAVTIPGTKCIELAALGVPHLVCIPFNSPERVVINGPLTYLDRLPVIGTPLKRAAVLAFAGRFKYYSQPNIDAGEEIVPEMAGTLTPGRVAERAAALAGDDAWLQAVTPRLQALYAAHRGATERIVRGILREAAA